MNLTVQALRAIIYHMSFKHTYKNELSHVSHCLYIKLKLKKKLGHHDEFYNTFCFFSKIFFIFFFYFSNSFPLFQYFDNPREQFSSLINFTSFHVSNWLNLKNCVQENDSCIPLFCIKITRTRHSISPFPANP